MPIEHDPDERRCPFCNRVNNAHTTDDPAARPEPGDVSICWACRCIGIFTADGVRPPTPAELKEISADPDIRAALDAMVTSSTPADVHRRNRRGGR